MRDASASERDSVASGHDRKYFLRSGFIVDRATEVSSRSSRRMRGLVAVSLIHGIYFAINDSRVARACPSADRPGKFNGESDPRLGKWTNECIVTGNVRARY